MEGRGGGPHGDRAVGSRPEDLRLRDDRHRVALVETRGDNHCVCVQLAVVGLLGGVEMLLDQEGARHPGGGAGRGARGPTASLPRRCARGAARSRAPGAVPSRPLGNFCLTDRTVTPT